MDQSMMALPGRGKRKRTHSQSEKVPTTSTPKETSKPKTRRPSTKKNNGKENDELMDTTMVTSIQSDKPKRVVKKGKRRIEPKDIVPITPTKPRVRSNSVSRGVRFTSPNSGRVTTPIKPNTPSTTPKTGSTTPVGRVRHETPSSGRSNIVPRKLLEDPTIEAEIAVRLPQRSMPLLPIAIEAEQNLMKLQERRKNEKKASKSKDPLEKYRIRPEDEVYDHEFWIKRYHQGYRRPDDGLEMANIPEEKLHPLSQITGVMILWGNSCEGHEEEDSEDEDAETDDGPKERSVRKKKRGKLILAVDDYQELLSKAGKRGAFVEKEGYIDENGVNVGPTLTDVAKLIQKKTKFDFPEAPKRQLLSQEQFIYEIRKHHWKAISFYLSASLEGIVDPEIIQDIVAGRRKKLEDPIKLGAEIERHVWYHFPQTLWKYRNRMISRRFALMKNPELRLDMLSGKMSVEDFCTCHPFDLATTELKQLRHSWLVEFIDSHYLPQQERRNNELVRCHRCKSGNVVYNLYQLARADEGMTALCYCQDCGRGFKIQC